VLFGDVKQNIYGQPTEQKDVVTNVLGFNELKYCYRSDFKVCDLARSFQEQIFVDKYVRDDFKDENDENMLDLSVDKEGYINYMYLQNTSFMPALYNIIRGNILNKTNNISPNDIVILGCTSKRLRLFDSYYRYCSHERTKSMLETVESMYMTHLNYKGKDFEEADEWLKNIMKQLAKKLFPKRESLYDNDIIKLRQHIAKLFTIFDLYQSYTETFETVLKNECDVCKISIEAFLAFREYYKEDLLQFKNEVYQSDYKIIRDNKKLHFWMNSGTVKISTIHSFKGWESEVIFLIIEPNYNEESFDELLYTGITRARRNLVIINFGNQEYDTKIRPLIKDIK
jgi:superfamily I DNA/RNA helicase